MLPERDDLAILALLREAALGRTFSPPTDVYSTDAKVVISIELPGVPEDDVAVSTDGAALRITGRRAFTGGGEGVDYYRLERTYGAFDYPIPLPAGSRPGERSLTWADGVLTIVIPRG
jgi:HSP20 family protein